jgi:hypothetical protein
MAEVAHGVGGITSPCMTTADDVTTSEAAASVSPPTSTVAPKAGVMVTTEAVIPSLMHEAMSAHAMGLSDPTMGTSSPQP